MGPFRAHPAGLDPGPPEYLSGWIPLNCRGRNGDDNPTQTDQGSCPIQNEPNGQPTGMVQGQATSEGPTKGLVGRILKYV